MKVCKNCGEINVNDSLYCCNCGQSNFILREETVCPHCGAVNDKTFTHCINCGNPLSEKGGAVAVPVEQGGTVTYDGIGMMSVPSETARCPHCGDVVPITAIFCQKCGTSVANLHSHRVVQRKVCPHCGRLNKIDANFCSYCFISLLNADTQQLQVTHDAQNLGDLTVRQTYLEGADGKKVICPNCGTLNEPEEAFCVNCGLKLVLEEPKKYCPNCGSENSADNVFCAKCRFAFEGDVPKKETWICPSCDSVNDKADLFCTNCGQKKQ